MRCSLRMVYQWTEELSIRTNGVNRKASLTNGDFYQWYYWWGFLDDWYLFVYIGHVRPIQTSNFCRIWFVQLNSTRQKCDVWTGPYGIRIKSYAWIFTIQVTLSSILFIHFHAVCLNFETRPILYFFFNIAGVLLSIIVFKSVVAQASQSSIFDFPYVVYGEL